MKTRFKVSNITISYIKPDDIADLVEMLKNPAVCEHVFFGPNTKEETEEYFVPLIDSINRSLKKHKMPDDHVFIIRKDGLFIGNCALISNHYNSGCYTVGYTIDEPFWKQGYGDMSLKFLIDYGFNKLNAYRLNGDCMSGNWGSRKIMENNGFKLEGRQKNYWYKNGGHFDNLLFGLLKSDIDF
jgi:RimJ/RimL family protein N-acetyltransferase